MNTTESTRIDLLLTAQTPISHHDPANNDGSNVLTFNRQKQRVLRQHNSAEISQEDIDEFCQAHPVPLDLLDVFRSLKFSEFAATSLVKELIDIYNSLDGEGLFSGMNRYEMLESRLRSASVRSFTLPRLWSLVTKDLKLPIHGGKHDRALVDFFGLPLPIQESVIMAIVKEYRSIVTIARVWCSQVKLGNEIYAAAAGQTQLSGLDQVEVVRYNATDVEENHGHVILDIPSVSANSLRHQAVRAPGWEHLVRTIDLDEEVPVSAEAIFVNGGNIRAGAKQPQAAFLLAELIKSAYPLLDLLGGVTDSFDLGESRLSVASWLVCAENAGALAEYDGLSGLKTSVFDLLDDVTHTRQATEHGVGQMIWNFETLCPGTQIVLRLVLKPFASNRTRGALMAALQTYLERSTVAGQSARGYGVVTGQLLNGAIDAGALQEYEEYLHKNTEQLRGWMMDGTLGCGHIVVS
jgi:hypothetical protein